MPEPSINTMKRHELAAAIMAHDTNMLPQYAHYLAGKMKRAAQRRDLGFYTALKVLGISSDTTARDAIRNMERAA